MVLLRITFTTNGCKESHFQSLPFDEHRLQFFCNLSSPKNLTCLSSKLRTQQQNPEAWAIRHFLFTLVPCNLAFAVHHMDSCLEIRLQIHASFIGKNPQFHPLLFWTVLICLDVHCYSQCFYIYYYFVFSLVQTAN